MTILTTYTCNDYCFSNFLLPILRYCIVLQWALERVDIPVCKRLAGPALYSKIEQLRSRLQANPNPTPALNNTTSVCSYCTASMDCSLLVNERCSLLLSKPLQFRMWMTCCSRCSLRTTRSIPGRRFSWRITTLTRWIWTSSTAAMDNFPSSQI